MPGFALASVYVEFVADKVALGQAFLSPSVFSCQYHSTVVSVLIYHLGMNNRPVGGRSSETVSPHRHEQQQQQEEP
jgi:hypothetical protein